MLLDSNIIIYACQPGCVQLYDFIRQQAPYLSKISYLETLGYQRLTIPEKDFLQRLFNQSIVLPISDEVIYAATHLRQQRKMSLGDALIAGTALTHQLTLVTRNIKDFAWIDGLLLLNPLKMMG